MGIVAKKFTAQKNFRVGLDIVLELKVTTVYVFSKVTVMCNAWMRVVFCWWYAGIVQYTTAVIVYN
jgi:hypothetical protein